MTVKSNLLSIVQDILSDLNADEVNSITDTEDSEQVARIIKATYLAIVSKNNWPHTRRALTILARSNTDFPTHMLIKEELKELVSINYNKAKVGEVRKRYTPIKYLFPDEFLRKTNTRDNTSAEVDVVIDDSGIELLISNNKHPDYYTSFNDNDLVFDSYLSTVDSSLQVSKVQAQGFIIPEFLLEDSFVPDLPADAFSLLIEESTSRAQFKMRQFVDTKAEQESGRQRRTMSQKSWSVNSGNRFPNYGRRSKINTGREGVNNG